MSAENLSAILGAIALVALFASAASLHKARRRYESAIESCLELEQTMRRRLSETNEDRAALLRSERPRIVGRRIQRFDATSNDSLATMNNVITTAAVIGSSGVSCGSSSSYDSGSSSSCSSSCD